MARANWTGATPTLLLDAVQVRIRPTDKGHAEPAPGQRSPYRQLRLHRIRFEFQRVDFLSVDGGGGPAKKVYCDNRLPVACAALGDLIMLPWRLCVEWMI